MAKRKVIWTETAARQRRQILAYWIERNGSKTYAEKLIRHSTRHLAVIAKNPEAFAETEYTGIRESAMGHFSIYYKQLDDQIVVMAFWDNRQDPLKLFHVITKRPF
jgi:plasmid stabilization system protein ParE